MKQLADIRRAALQAQVYVRRIAELDALRTLTTIERIERQMIVNELWAMGLNAQGNSLAPPEGF